MKTTLTKSAIERAQWNLNKKIQLKLTEWEKLHPATTERLSHLEAFDLAIKDPAWIKISRERAAKDWSPETCRSQLISDSPKANEADKKRKALNDKWEKNKESFKRNLEEKAEKLMNEAIITNIDPVKLLRLIEDFE